MNLPTFDLSLGLTTEQLIDIRKFALSQAAAKSDNFSPILYRAERIAEFIVSGGISENPHIGSCSDDLLDEDSGESDTPADEDHTGSSINDRLEKNFSELQEDTEKLGKIFGSHRKE